MEILTGKGEKGRVYLIIPKKMYGQYEAVDYAKRLWHCKSSECILCGAKRKKGDIFYVELPFDEGTHWSVYRGSKYDPECLKRFMFGCKKEAKGV